MTRTRWVNTPGQEEGTERADPLPLPPLPPVHSDGPELEQRKPAATLPARQRCQGRRLDLALQFFSVAKGSVDDPDIFPAHQCCQGRRLDLA